MPRTLYKNEPVLPFHSSEHFIVHSRTGGVATACHTATMNVSAGAPTSENRVYSPILCHPKAGRFGCITGMVSMADNLLGRWNVICPTRRWHFKGTPTRGRSILLAIHYIFCVGLNKCILLKPHVTAMCGNFLPTYI